MNKSTRSYLNLTDNHIADLLYRAPSRIRSNSYSNCEQSQLDSLPQHNSSISMSTSQLTTEFFHEEKHDDSASPLNNKVILQSLREQEKKALQSINKLTEEEMNHIEKWLSILYHTYESLEYPLIHRVSQATTYFDNEQQLCYKQVQAEINNDWSCFCDRLKQHIQERQKEPRKFSTLDNSSSNVNEMHSLENLIDMKFNKYSGVGDAKIWLLQTMNQFRQCGLCRLEQFHSIPLLLIDEAYLWYINHIDSIINFESFSKLFLQQYSSTALVDQHKLSPEIDTPSVNVFSSTSTSHLQQTIADDIIKRPTFFRGSKDDVHEWLEKLEQRFKMAKWDDEQKLQYISIHLQEDAYRWWTQTSTTIKTWSIFTEAVTKAFGSTKVQELAFEQLKWYKQTIGQSITQYYDKIIELCKKVDPAMPGSLKLKYLMASIRESLKLHVALQDPKTTDAFLSVARKVKDTLTLTNTTNEAQLNNFNMNAATSQNLSVQSNSTQQSINKNYDDTSPNARSQSHHQYYHYNTPNWKERKNRNRKFTRNSQNVQRSNNCYNCGTPGHYARDCTRTHFG